MDRLFLSSVVILVVVLVFVAIGMVLFRVWGLRLNPETKPSAALLIVIIGIFLLALAALVLVGPHHPHNNAEKKKTETILSVLRTGLDLHFANTGQVPTSVEALQQVTFKYSSAAEELRSLKALSANPPGFLDGWGQPILIELLEPGRFRLASSGRDLKPGTKDDLVVEWPEPVLGPKPTTSKPTSKPASVPVEIEVKP